MVVPKPYFERTVWKLRHDLKQHYNAQVKGRLGQAGNPVVRGKLSHLLDAAQKGIAQNPTATPEDQLIFVSGVLETVVPAEVAAAKKAEAAAEAASAGEGEISEGQCACRQLKQVSMQNFHCSISSIRPIFCLRTELWSLRLQICNPKLQVSFSPCFESKT